MKLFFPRESSAVFQLPMQCFRLRQRISIAGTAIWLWVQFIGKNRLPGNEGLDGELGGKDEEKSVGGIAVYGADAVGPAGSLDED